jgi:predicted transcriptional regulator
MGDEPSTGQSDILALTTEIVAAHVSNNRVENAELGDFIGAVFGKLNQLANEHEQPVADLVPAVPIRRSVTDDYIVCLEDGKKLKMLKRHLMTSYGITPEEYRAKWGLRADYPMVAPNYAARRRELAMQIGLGRKPLTVVPETPAPKATRKRKAA